VSNQTLKIVIPMAGFGTRLRPHTWSRPKQLLRIADKSVLEHVLDTFSTLHDPGNIEFIFIIGYLGAQIEAYMNNNHPDTNVRYIEQSEMRGQSHAIHLTREFLGGPMLMVFADTLIETDLSFLVSEPAEAVAWVKAVPDPRRFGVAELGVDGWVNRLVEKPTEIDNNLAVVGCYYFHDSCALVDAIEEQFRRDIQLKGEYFLADAVNILLERGLKMRSQPVNIWLDAGTKEDVLASNRYLLDHGHANSTEAAQRKDIVIIPPVYIHPSAQVENSVIGPYTAIGAACQIQSCILSNSIVDDGANVTGVVMEHSMIGRQTHISRSPGVLNIGDQTELTL
jgi:glucose-1-phosphate thymidylyltransferase